MCVALRPVLSVCFKLNPYRMQAQFKFSTETGTAAVKKDFARLFPEGEISAITIDRDKVSGEFVANVTYYVQRKDHRKPNNVMAAALKRASFGSQKHGGRTNLRLA